MKKRLRFVLSAAIITVGAIFFFQLYWVFNSYETSERNFQQQVTNVLQRSIENYELRINDAPATLKEKQPLLSVVVNTTPEKNGQQIKGGIRRQQMFQYNMLKVTTRNLRAVQVLVARLMSEALDKPVDLTLLNALFRKELAANKISLAFRLTLVSGGQEQGDRRIIAYVPSSKSELLVEAVPDKRGLYLFKQNFIPTSISVILILLSAGSLFYMIVIIRRQLELDTMKNDFINNITHELRTPISILKTANEALYQYGQASNPEKNERYLRINGDILNKLDENVDRILEITQYEHGKKAPALQPVRLQAVIAEVVDRFSFVESNSISIHYHLPDEVVNTDAYVIDTVLSNLIDNAVKYAERAAVVDITLSAEGQDWTLEVADNGPGIPEASLPYIFDKFYRVPSGDLHNVKGYGLGLSYVNELVKSLHGTISVTSKPLSGTVFTIKFPASWTK